MTVPGVVAPPGPQDARERAAAPARRRRSAVVASALLAVALVAAGLWWATHPQRLQPVGSGVELPLAIGDSAVVGMSAQPLSGEVHLVEAEPVVTANSSDAAVRVLLCRDAVGLSGGTVLGSSRGRAEQVCGSTSEVRDATLAAVGPGSAYLVVEVTPRRPGTVVVEGLRVRYRTLLQRGEQTSGVVVTARTAATP